MRALRKALCVGPGLLVSTVLVLVVVGPLLPAPARLGLLIAGPAVTVWLLTGLGEPYAVRVLFRARGPAAHERAAIMQLRAQLAELGVGPERLIVLVSRAGSAPWAIARGRRTVVVSAGLAAALGQARASGRSGAGDAFAPVAHAASVARLGLNRQDPAICFWSLPWGLAIGVARAVVSLIGPLWATRPLVAGVAIWQALTVPADPAAPGPRGVALAASIAALLASTYLVPWAERSWDRYVSHAGDRALADAGLGLAMASWLTRLPQTPEVMVRRQKLLLARPDEPAYGPAAVPPAGSTGGTVGAPLRLVRS